MKNSSSLFVIAISIFIVFSMGCATVLKGSTQTVTIDSNIRGAQIIVNGTPIGRTPYTGPIKRGSDTTILVRKQGYGSKRVTLNTSVEPIFFGNIICGGVTGSTTDFATGSMYKYSPSTIQVDFD